MSLTDWISGKIEGVDLNAAFNGAARALGVVEHGIQHGIVEIGAGIVGLASDTVINGGYELISGERLYDGSAEDWTRRNVNNAIDTVQETASFGAIKPITNMSETEQRVAGAISLTTQFAIPAAGVASGIAKGRHLLDATRAAHTASPQAGLLRNFFDDAAHFTQNPVASTRNALGFTVSSNNAVSSGTQIAQQTVQFAGLAP